MAQNECQMMGLNDFYANLRNLLSTTYNTMNNLKRASEFLASLDATTFESAPPAGMGGSTDVTASLGHLRTAINEILDFYDGSGTTQTRVLKTYINQFRHI